MARKFFREVYTITVLSEDAPLGCVELDTVQYAITEGDRSGEVEYTECREVTAAEMAKLLVDQGSGPDFFGLDENGNDIEDE